ncbi:MAG: tetratricopeptide repeat protein, partial [Spirulinaceae cyanobacterium]
HYQSAIEQDILPQLKVGAYNNLGTLLQAVGEFPEAQKAYETAIKIAPNFAVGYYNLAMNYKELGQFHQAVTAYQQAIKINPRYAEAYQNLGVAYWKLGKVPESIGAFQEAIALHEKDNPEEAERLREGLQKMGMGNY